MRIKGILICLIGAILLIVAAHPHAYTQINANPKQIDSIKRLLARTSLDSEKVLLLLALSDEFPEDCQTKLSYAEQAYNLAQKSAWNRGLYASLWKMADVYKICFNDFPNAIKQHEKRAIIAQKNNDTKYVLITYVELAEIYKALGQYATAIDYNNKILVLATDKSSIIGTLGNIGTIYSEIGDFTKALATYERAVKIMDDTIRTNKQISDDFLLGRSGLQITIASIYVANGEYDRALDLYQKVLNVQNDFIRSMAYMGMGNAFFKKKDFDKSVVYYEKALRIYTTLGMGNKEDILIELAKIYCQKKDAAKALSYATEAYDAAEKNNNELRLAKINTTLGEIENMQKQHTKAVSYLNKAITISQRINAQDYEKDAWLELSEAYTGLNQHAKAFEAYKNYITLRDSVYNTEKARELTRIDLQGEFDRKQTADSIREADEKKIAAFRLQRQQVMSYSGFAGVLIAIIVALLIYRNYSNSRKANRIISQANETIKEEKQVSENLLLNILPEHVANELKAKGDVEAKQFDNVTILFTDFVNFTITSEKLTPSELVAELHTCFKAFDEIIGKYKIEKIKTVGDAYLAAAGLPDVNANHAADIVNAAIDIRDFMATRKQELGDRTFAIRLGVNSGTVVAGIVGVKKFAYDIWGDAVNTAARMEQNSEHFKINLSQSTYNIVKDDFQCTYRGELAAKNKGLLKMYFAEPKSA
jgi:adenylate cyclase